MNEEWNQYRADNRSQNEMRCIALDALEFADDEGPAYVRYAAAHRLTVDEIVYYLNAYEAGGDIGLQAIRNPDIMPAAYARKAAATVAKTLDRFLEGRLSLRITDEGTAIGVYEIQRRRNGDEYLFKICQLRVTLAADQWHLYWWRSFRAWWPYPPPERGPQWSLTARLRQLTEDPDGCFWG